MKSFVALGLAMLAASASAATITVKAGDDFEAVCLKVVQPGDTCYLEKGTYRHDGLTVTHGTKDKRITITGHSEACIKGSNTQDRVLQIAHDYYTVKGLCFNGSHGNDDYVATAIYVLGADYKTEKNGVLSSVTGFQMFDNEIKNFSGECVHFRYFVTHAEVSGNSIQKCGIDAFAKGKRGKVGEGIYLGTALSQVDDGKAPEYKLRTGSADNVKVDVCTQNWIHHNTFRTYGNECVDVKEGSTNNLIEYNVCEKQKDDNSGCFGSRGSGNTIRFNDISGCVGAGVRVGGGDGYGEDNNIYGNVIKNCDRGAFNVMSPKQGTVCENMISGVDLISFGAEDDQSQFSEAVATGGCSSYPGDLGKSPSPAPESEDEEVDDPSPAPSPVPESEEDDGDGRLKAGVNYANGAEDSEPVIEVIDTNESAGTSGHGTCGNVGHIERAWARHSKLSDPETFIRNLFDGKNDTYYSVKLESTHFTFELEEETEVNGIAIGFFMKDASEQRIQKFSIGTKGDEKDDIWVWPIVDKESSGKMGGLQTFSFSSRKARQVRIKTIENDFNIWSAFTEVEVCLTPAEESDALFNGIGAIEEELDMLAGRVCSEPTKLAPVISTCSGDDNVKDIFDGNFETRWTTVQTTGESNLSKGQVRLTFEGETRVSTVNIAVFDGHLAHQYFSVYVQSSTANTWTSVMVSQQAALEDTMQSFDVELDGVYTLYIIAEGNDVGLYSKISEIEVLGC